MRINQLRMGTMISLLSVGIGSVIQLFYTPIFLNYLGSSDYGINSFIQSIMGYLSMLNLGFGTTMLRYLVQYEEKNEIEKYKYLVGIFLVIFIILSLICIIIGILIYSNLPFFLQDSFSFEEIMKTQKIFLILLINMSISFPFIICSTYIHSKERFLYLRGLSFFTLVMNPITGLILLKFGFGLVAITVSTLCYSILTIILNIFYSVYLGIKIKFYFKDFTLIKELFKFSFYIFLGILIDRLYWSTDRLIIGKYLGAATVGVYSISSVFNQMYMSISTSVSEVLSPKVNQLTVKKSNLEISDLFIKVGRIQYILMGLICTGFLLFGKEFITFWVGKSYSKDIYYMTLWIMLPLTVPLIQNTGIVILQAKNLHKFRSLIYFIIALLNIFFSLILVNNYGALGCSIGTGISFCIGNIIIINIYYYKKVELDIVQFWKEILHMTYPIFISIILGYILKYFLPPSTILLLLLEIVLYTIVYILLMFLRGLNKEEKKMIVQFWK
ncbi:hypothetical protein EGX98_02615 [Fusobacterium necrophorum]|nr:oligosaccharide flippase family protein [Fusobacterium necrophorum]AYZ73041.1 hypothetical protein EGX98_02615 [Fusobacterium necrophorum]AZW08959.1 hypothetical protein EO219_04780 [Fusobacterium necrophorum subsp. necrophorum]SDB39778.1 Membrane protein involved in the export of O-antigen and teichoic acid [Fusobacterium necrophorum]SQD09945.1 Polysaccharide biosynthesis protein [Fusobacterium necrophorum subsp. necrophorum]